MLKKYLNNSNFKLLLSSIEEGENCSVFGLNIGEKLALVEDSANLFYIVENLEQANIVYDKLSSLGRNCELLTEPINCLTSEFLRYEKTLKVLVGLKNSTIDTLILTPEILACKLPNSQRLSTINLTVGQELIISEFIKKLISFNYKRVDMVTNTCEFSVRGDVIDIYPLNGQPSRIFVDYDTIESIKLYNSITMLTTNDLKELEITSNIYYQVNNVDITSFFQSHKLNFDEAYDRLLLDDLDYRKICFDSDFNSTIFDYVTSGLIVFDGAKNIYDKLDMYIKEFNKNLSNLEKPFNVICADQKLNLNNALKFNNSFTLLAFHYIQQSNRIFNPTKVFSIRTLPATKYHGYNDVLLLDISNYLKQNYTVILCAGTDEDANKFKDFFEKNKISSFLLSRLTMCNKNTLNIISRSYPLDVILPEDKLVVISTESLLGKKKKIIDTDKSFFDGELPKANDYVVHDFHGIGKCLGVETLKISNAYRDYVIIEYKNSDKLYLPVENIDQISKYVGSEKTPTINKIGGVEFAKTKTKVKSSIKKIAFDLIELYRERLNLVGYKYSADDEFQQKFENNFGFDETVDQLKAIEDCKKDMETGKVMDRLICGDVGFGKTEVALRIAFKTILSGKQVALLCPTTILSEQHYNTAKSRMADFGVKVEVLNRLKNSTEITRIKKDIKDGKIDLICGTHKLLASDIDYKNLGLLILDEEQKFGVADKEKIKKFKKQINVLTLSATPIPRTLNMSLIGVRDISVIETPPIQRQPSDVQVVEYSDYIVKSAIERELNRNGQVLIIYNRVETIYKFSSFIKNLVPDALVSVAHGQMNEVELEEEIYKLYSNQTQVLVATTLIENGVDLPNANTLIVINSDMLGLSQLYQLKGRIGRSDRNSYAYFTFDSKKLLTENAYKRLQAIKEFSEMGSGFKIAMRDLEIRGAGSLLGLEQSGHIEKIGYNLYVQLLSESVKELKGENLSKKMDVRVETNLSAYLSHNYVASSSRRMVMYREIANINSIEKLLEFIKNTESIYGDLPSELVSLAKIGFIKNLCSSINAFKISIKEKINIYLNGKEAITRELVEATEYYKENINLNLAGEPIIEIKNIKSGNVLDFLINYLQLIINK